MQDNISSLIANIASKSNSDDVFIIGKGPGLDSIDLAALSPGLIININDSERARAGDVGIFSANWVRHSLADEGFRCSSYLAGKPLPPSVLHEVLPPIPIDLDQEDLATLRLEREEFFDESFVLLNALKLALRVAKLRGHAQTVYLLGFDFSTITGSISQKVGFDFSGAQGNDRDAIIIAQEHEFRQFLHHFSNGDRLVLRHVGKKEYSSCTPAAFNRLGIGLNGQSELRSADIDLGNPDRVLIVAELTNNHLGNPDRLIEMIERSKECGADLIKVQKRDVDSFYSQEQLNSYYWSPYGTTLGDYRRGVELSDELLELLQETCRKCDIDWFCSVLDYPSFEKIRHFQPKLIKIPSTISNHRAYHANLAASYRGPIVVSTGLTEAEYVNHVLETYSQNEVIYLLHCVSAYPTPRSECNVAVVNSYNALAAQDSRIIPGYSSHDLGSTGCMLAVAAGARMLEKHVKLGNVEWIHFDKVAIDLTGDGFARFVADVRLAEEIVGNGEKRVTASEHHKYSVQSS